MREPIAKKPLSIPKDKDVIAAVNCIRPDPKEI
jgi:hypothetical protein